MTRMGTRIDRVLWQVLPLEVLASEEVLAAATTAAASLDVSEASPPCGTFDMKFLRLPLVAGADSCRNSRRCAAAAADLSLTSGVRGS